MDLGLAGQIAIVTGSTKGLGFATARSLLDEGCNVTICARGEEGLAEEHHVRSVGRVVNERVASAEVRGRVVRLLDLVGLPARVGGLRA